MHHYLGVANLYFNVRLLKPFSLVISNYLLSVYTHRIIIVSMWLAQIVFNCFCSNNEIFMTTAMHNYD